MAKAFTGWLLGALLTFGIMGAIFIEIDLLSLVIVTGLITIALLLMWIVETWDKS